MELDGNRLLLGIGPESDLEPAVRAFRTVLVLARRLHGAMDDLLRPAGLTTQQAAVLTVVIALGTPSLAETADALGSTRQNTAQIVDALVRKGLLVTDADPRDRRRRALRASTANAALWAERDAADVAAVADWFGGLAPEELQTFCDLADRVLARLGARGAATVREG